MTTSAEPPETTHLSADLACSCGYNLRGLAIIGRCPECGQPVLTSLRGGALHDADPRWRRRIRISVALIAWLPLLYFLPLVLAFSPSPVGLFLVLSPIVTGCVGAWLISRAEPGTRPDLFTRAKAVTLRCGIAVTTALSAITLLHSEARAFGFLIFSMFAGVACIPLIFDRLWQLARRADERALSMTFRVIAWLLPACILLSGNMLPEIWVRALPGDVGPYLRVGALISVRVMLILSLFSMGRLYQAIPRQ